MTEVTHRVMGVGKYLLVLAATAIFVTVVVVWFVGYFLPAQRNKPGRVGNAVSTYLPAVGGSTAAPAKSEAATSTASQPSFSVA